MVELVGVTHGAWITDFFMTTTKFPLHPSSDFLSYLEKFPKGTRVGIESLSKSDFEIVRQDLCKKNYDFVLEYGERYMKSYAENVNDYWNVLTCHLKNLGLETIYLENLLSWFEINDSIVKESMMLGEVHEKILFKEENESEIDYAKKLLTCNEMIHKTKLDYRKLHEQKRDCEFLKKISEKEIDIAVVGIGHSDFWYNIKEKINQKYKVNFEKYSTDRGLFDKRGIAR